MPVFGLGTWRMGGGYKKGTNTDKADINAIRAAIKLGVMHIDTAELYGEGHTEELVGKAIRGNDRKKLFIASKVNGQNLSYRNVINSCKASLKRLKTDYLDLYIIHWPNHKISIKTPCAPLTIS